MTNQPTLSNNTIILLLVFLCAALMASVFVYHASHQQLPETFANGDATLFPVGREIKSFALTTTDHQPFTEKNFHHHWTLVFFGFSHCSSICPSTLASLDQAYSKLASAQPNLQVVFVSLDPERDSFTQLAKYTHAFNSKFIGVTGKLQNIRKLQSQLGIYSERDNTASQYDYQLKHTPSILLINPEGKWIGLLKNDLPVDTLTNAIFSMIKKP